MSFSGFINEFSNSPIQPSYQSYLALDFTSVTAVQLEWPFVNPNTETPYAQIIQVTVNPSATNKIIMPDATMASQGQTNTIINTGAQPILVYAFGGTTLVATLESTQLWYLTLTDNTNADGAWLPQQMGSTASAATAAELIDSSEDSNGHVNAGGLAAFPTNFLKQNILVNTFESGTTYTQSTGDRGSLLVWTAGTGTYQCMSLADAGTGFNFSILNNTIGSRITVQPQSGELMNGVSTNFILNPGDSCSFTTDVTENSFYAYLSSTSQSSVVGVVDISLTSAVSNEITLTPTEASYSIQKYQGNPSSSVITIIYPNNIPAEWIAYNASFTNPISVTLQSGSNAFQIAPGNRLFLFSDGSDIYDTPNFMTDTTIYFNNGSEIAPSITFLNDSTSGFYRITTAGTLENAVAVTQASTDTMYFMNTANYSIPTLYTLEGTYIDRSISIYSLMRAYD